MVNQLEKLGLRKEHLFLGLVLIVSVDLAPREDAMYLPCLLTEQGVSGMVLPKSSGKHSCAFAAQL